MAADMPVLPGGPVSRHGLCRVCTATCAYLVDGAGDDGEGLCKAGVVQADDRVDDPAELRPVTAAVDQPRL